MTTLQKIFKECESTGGWFGIEITSLNDRNYLDDTPLHTVCTWGDLEPVQVLLEAGADINAIGDQGATPIFNAIISRNEKLIKHLLKCGASKNAMIFGDSALYQYAKNTGLDKKLIETLK